METRVGNCYVSIYVLFPHTVMEKIVTLFLKHKCDKSNNYSNFNLPRRCSESLFNFSLFGFTRATYFVIMEGTDI